MQPLLLVFLIAVVFAVNLLRRRRYRSLRHIRGPPVPSWLLGHDYAITRQEEAGQLDHAWLREYGPTWRIGGHLGTEMLMTGDPKAFQHILHKSGYNYPKRRDLTKTAQAFVGGPGITTVEGEVHQRQRKIMNPAFSATQLRGFLPLFQEIGKKLCEKWERELTPDKTVFVNKWLARTTLDIIGAAAFDYDFGALDETENHLAKEYSSLFLDAFFRQSKPSIFFRTMWTYFPGWLITILKNAPTQQLRRLARASNMFREVSTQLLTEKAADISAKVDEGYKDAMTILVKANASEEPKSRLSDAEMQAQMQTLTLAGHETTANTVSWLLFELAGNPEYQMRMRTEIRAARERMAARGDIRFSIDDLDNMPLLNNAIKETLRFHSIVFNLQREALKDDIIPLSEPIVSANGEVLDAIPVKAGHWITLSFFAYHRLKQVWGEDADIWNPDRFSHIDPTKQIKVGVYANLATFSGGVRGCIGWRFSLIEMQALVSELVEKFEFSVPKDEAYDVQGVPAGAGVVPLVRGKWDLGPVIPLCVSPAAA